MATTLERKDGGAVLPEPRSVPAEEMVTAPEQKVELHEMPDLAAVAPEVTYEQPKRSWLRYLAVGIAVGAVAVGGGLVISAVTSTDTTPEFAYDYSVAREHLAQTPGGFPIVTDSGQVVPRSTKLTQEHVVQAPQTTLDAYGGQPYVRPDSPSPYAGANQGPVNDAPGSYTGANEGPVNDAPGTIIG
jgi:hypothetical protein